MPEWVDIIVSVLSGLAITIPLIVKLVQYAQLVVKEKNWQKLLEIISHYMQEAEQKFSTGAEKKDYVMMAIKASSDLVNYDIDMEVVSKLIDDLCVLTKTVNAPVENVEEVSEPELPQ